MRRVQEAFGIVVIVVAVGGAIVALFTVLGSGSAYREIGRGRFSIDEQPPPAGPAPGSPAAAAEREAEVRQMIEARNVRRERRGEAPVDVEAEVAGLMAQSAAAAPEHDAELREEVRQLVLARNARRMRKGQEPVDVEAEVERQLREL